MTAEPIDVDLDDLPEFAAIVEKLLASGQPRQLRRDGKVLGVLSPQVIASRVGRDPSLPMTAEQEAALKAAAGSLEGLLDPDEMHRNLEESRRLSISKRRYD